MEIPKTVSGDPKTDLELFKTIFSEDAAFRFREVSDDSGIGGALCFFDGMANGPFAAESISEPLASALGRGEEVSAKNIWSTVTNCELRSENSVEKLITAVMYGDTLVFVRGGAFVAGTKNWLKRTVSEPKGESVILGPREGFIESALDNVSMIRRRLKTDRLRVELLTVGDNANNFVYICSVRGVADEKVRSEVKRRISE
ncbi:MAG: spore germination protein, partial [Clostridia bacterium]|nr:spore germination protein [Clostridia bacterium]